MRKLRLVFISMISLGLIYLIGSLLHGIIKHSEKKKKHDFSYVDLNFKIHTEDIGYFTENTKENMDIQYTSTFKNYQYLSLYRYKNKYNLIIRKLANKPVNLKSLFNLKFAKNKPDLAIRYNMQEAYPFIYKIDVERKHNLNNDLIINGNHIKILKHTPDSLLIHGNILDLAIGKKDSYVNELFYLQDETLFRRAISTEMLLFNRDNKLYFYIIFPDGKQGLPNNILNEIH